MVVSWSWTVIRFLSRVAIWQLINKLHELVKVWVLSTICKLLKNWIYWITWFSLFSYHVHACLLWKSCTFNFYIRCLEFKNEGAKKRMNYVNERVQLTKAIIIHTYCAWHMAWTFSKNVERPTNDLLVGKATWQIKDLCLYNWVINTYFVLSQDFFIHTYINFTERALMPSAPDPKQAIPKKKHFYHLIVL